MRVVVLGQAGPYAPVALRELQRAPGPWELVLLVEGHKSPVQRLRHRLRAPRPGPWPDGESLADLAVAMGVPVLQTCEVNEPGAIDVLREAAPDWLVCLGFDRLFGRAVLGTARLGGINAHPSDLPRLRGPSPIYWALREDHQRLGVTLHALDVREDHGPIYAKEFFTPAPTATGDRIFATAGQLAGRMLAALLARAATGQLVGTPQDERLATRAPRPRPEDALITPHEWRCEHLVRFACGAPYFRTPWLTLAGENYFVRRGLLAEVGRRIPGEFSLVGSTLIVQCRDGLAHLEVQV